LTGIKDADAEHNPSATATCLVSGWKSAHGRLRLHCTQKLSFLVLVIAAADAYRKQQFLH